MSEPDLFSQSGTMVQDSAIPSDQANPAWNSRSRIRSASVWAAYGDALGWISELTNAAGLERRTRGQPLVQPMEWKRRIGGRAGVTAVLPRGCYSDDTQLRLATSRAIRPDGFDVEAFSKVELPVWLSYGLGGGKSTSAAASHLGRSSSIWWRNRFKGWTRSGGNGAAMRIQPHVWASGTPEQPESYLLNVVRNAVCTHSHPTGIMGAVLHAQCAAHALHTGEIPSASDLYSLLETASKLPALIESDRELTFWRIAFEEAAEPFQEVWARALDETKCAVAAAAGSDGAGEERYRNIVDRLKLHDPAQRGSGVLTSVAAAALAWCEPRAEQATRIAANALGTDTDTIATMAGAIIGATTDAEPPVEVLDADLIRCEADRLADIASGDKSAMHHPYPDLMNWLAPKAHADALARTEDKTLVVRGLGCATPLPDRSELAANGFQWLWVKLDFGQTLLVKGRKNLPLDNDASAKPRRRKIAAPRRDAPPSEKLAHGQRIDSPQMSADFSASQANIKPKSSADPGKIQDIVAYAHEHIDDDRAIGKMLRRVVSKGTTGEIAAFTAALIDLLKGNATTGIKTNPPPERTDSVSTVPHGRSSSGNDEPSRLATTSVRPN